MAYKEKKGRRGVKVVLLAGALILLILLITPGAAAPGMLDTSTVMAVQGAMTVDMVGGSGGSGPVMIPRRPSPRSPFQPPSWVPNPGPRARLR